MGGSEQRFWLTSASAGSAGSTAGAGGAAGAGGVAREPQFLTTLPSKTVKNLPAERPIHFSDE